jgi:dsDNA-specific endonuclease/ATPase MutS2
LGSIRGRKSNNILNYPALHNVRCIRIVHGKGIFVLQKAIKKYLNTHEFIKSELISSAHKDHGEEGATEANLVGFSVDKLNQTKHSIRVSGGVRL